MVDGVRAAGAVEDVAFPKLKAVVGVVVAGVPPKLNAVGGVGAVAGAGAGAPNENEPGACDGAGAPPLNEKPEPCSPKPCFGSLMVRARNDAYVRRARSAECSAGPLIPV